jgi:hypothetical protein
MNVFVLFNVGKDHIRVGCEIKRFPKDRNNENC